ncbi:MAG: UDP-3-O-acyl-N-acetylglucosamine deacetylase [Acidobacteriota bacterium]
MLSKSKKTIKNQVHLRGIGVHSGKMVNLWIQPSGSGKIIFQRTDKSDAVLNLDVRKIQAMQSSSLVQGDIKVRTLEHLMAVLFVYGINSAVIKLDGEEIPIFDGSALTFLKAVEKSGIKALPMNKKFIAIKKAFKIEEKGAYLSGEPNSNLKITYGIEYSHPRIGTQELSLNIDQNSFKREIAPARTFGFLKDAEILKKKKLALGSSLHNTIVLDDKEIINPPLRFKDEFVRHKILDLLGDLSLLGGELSGHFRAEKAGHYLHLQAVRFLLKNKDFCETM